MRPREATDVELGCVAGVLVMVAEISAPTTWPLKALHTPTARILRDSVVLRSSPRVGREEIPSGEKLPNCLAFRGVSC